MFDYIEETYMKPQRPLKFNWMHCDKIMTEVDATDKNNIKVINHTDDYLDKAFGDLKHPQEKHLEKLFRSRCVPETREDIFLVISALGLQYYDPYEIVKITRGITLADFYWIDFEWENLDWFKHIKPMREEDRIWTDEELKSK